VSNPLTTHPENWIQHAIGACIGAAVGDALGAPFEFRPAGLYRQTFPTPVLTGRGEMQGGGGWEPGECTDDTQMAIALTESLIVHQGFDADDIWARWRTWATTASDVGNITRAALSRPHVQGAARYAHERFGGQTAGNGTIMRNSPIALVGLAMPINDMRNLAVNQSALTHFDPDCGWAAAIHATMIRAGINGDDMFAAIDDTIDWLPSSAQDRWRALLRPDWTPVDGTFGNGTVWTCLAQAVWALRTTTSFADAVVSAIDLGDDADTVGCVAGSLAGARWGTDSIPARWTAHLTCHLTTPDGEKQFTAADLHDIACQLIGESPLPRTLDEPLITPEPTS